MIFKIHQRNTHNLHEQKIQRAGYTVYCRLVKMNCVEFEGNTRALIEAQSQSFSDQLTACAQAGLEPDTFCNATATSGHVASAARTYRQTGI